MIFRTKMHSDSGFIWIASLIILTIFFSSGVIMADELYANIGEETYLSGRFNPEKTSDFVYLHKKGIPVNRNSQMLRNETADALLKMYQALQKEHPQIPFQIISSTRNFNHQNGIWSAKFNGKRLVEGKKLNLTIPDPLERARKILNFSSMPGTSRHHWGTDFDLNDLNNEYFRRGNGKILYDWLQKNAARFGFCQPYTAGRSQGYLEERWHWSYKPLSARMTHDWLSIYEADPNKLFPANSFPGQNAARSLAPIYVKSINKECL